MLCSAAELELSEDHDGIIELPDDAPVGVAYARFAGLDDPVIDVAVTPNRPDATGVAGIARDLAAAGLGKLKTPTPEVLCRCIRLPDLRAISISLPPTRISARPSPCGLSAA